MKYIVAVLFLLSASLAFGQTRVNLTCNMYSPSQQTVECNNGGFPFIVPAGKWLCVTDMILVNKYPWNPAPYGPDMHTMYFMLYGISIAAHHPQVSLHTPFAYGPGTIYRGWISNGMAEDQYVYGIVTGRLWSNSECM